MLTAVEKVFLDVEAQAVDLGVVARGQGMIFADHSPTVV